MKKNILKKCSVFLFIFFFLITCFIPGTAIDIKRSDCQNSSKGDYLYVGGSGPGNYTFIQDAINDASNGDTVFVYDYSAPYYEYLLIDKAINLVGENQSSTIIDGKNTSTIIQIISNNVAVENFIIRSSGGHKNDACIFSSANLTTIKNCTIYRARTGIIFYNGKNIGIINCNIHTTGEGVYCTNTNNFFIFNSQLCHNAIGVRLENSNTSTIHKNYFHTSGICCYLYNSTNVKVDHCALDDNNDNQGGVYMRRCTNVLINNSNVCHNGFGINIDDSEDIIINHCNIKLNTKRGVRIKENVKNVSLISNDITKNYRYAIHTASPARLHYNNFYKNELHALYATAPCNATYNWWNSILGPSFTEFGLGERITMKNIRRLPWLLLKSPNAGANWETATYFTPIQVPDNTRPINLPGVDSDNDGVPDWWEIKYGYDPYQWDDHANLDPDNDGLNNFEECYTDQWGSHPFKKDIFLEIDWMETKYPETPNKPDQALVEKAIAIFAEHDINLHVDIGSMGGGQLIPYQDKPTFVDFRDIYWDYFLHQDLNNPRKGIFHYGIIVDYGDAGYALFGWDQLDSFNIAAQQLKDNFPLHSKKKLLMHGAIHELGHNLALFGDTFNGIDNNEATKITSLQLWKYINYKSVMNYHYTYRILGYSDGTNGPGDFDDWANLNLSFFKNTSFGVQHYS